MQSETLAQEFARLVKEYHEATTTRNRRHGNLLADYAVDNADAISAALSDKQAVEVKIKPLEWHEHGDLDFVWFRATPPVGYRYNIEDDVFTEKRHHVAVGQLSLGHFDTLIEAKAAAQADYEQRIRSALVDVPAVEPVAWQYFNDGAWRHSTNPTYHRETGYEMRPLFAHPPLREVEDSAEVERLRRVLNAIAHTYTEDSHGGTKSLPASEYQQMARDALAATRSGSATTQKGAAE